MGPVGPTCVGLCSQKHGPVKVNDLGAQNYYNGHSQKKIGKTKRTIKKTTYRTGRKLAVGPGNENENWEWNPWCNKLLHPIKYYTQAVNFYPILKENKDYCHEYFSIRERKLFLTILFPCVFAYESFSDRVTSAKVNIFYFSFIIVSHYFCFLLSLCTVLFSLNVTCLQVSWDLSLSLQPLCAAKRVVL